MSRFRIAVHYEESPGDGLQPDGSEGKDDEGRSVDPTTCKAKPMAVGSKSPLTRNFVCQNVTMARFTEKLRDLANDYIDHPVVDATGLQGGWNFALSFSPRVDGQ